jgi:N-sulfoglucosamine sulfohydrolase
MPALSTRASGNYSLILILLFVVSNCATQAQEDRPNILEDRPNILIAVADDAFYKYFGAYGAEWIDTPAFDRVAEQGVLFLNAYTPNAKCAPSRSILLTGRHSWQLEEAANHFPYFPKKFKTFAEVLMDNSYHVGFTGKGWGPGNPGTVNGKERQLLGPAYQEARMNPPTRAISAEDYASNFERFLEEKKPGQPFSFWYGAREPHRGYVWRSGIEIGGKKKSSIDYIPAYWPDNDTVRTEILDYSLEVEHFDRHLQRMLDILDQRGELANTVVIVTSDHGMPFPRQKSDAYEYSNHVPLAMMWADQIRNPGRTVDDFVSFIDIAPTILDVAGIDPAAAGMATITGKPLTGILRSGKSGRVEPDRDHALVGKERHDVGRPHDWGYPIRGIVTDHYLYLHNFEPDRWPAGNPETGYVTVDRSPTKTWILNNRTDPRYRQYWYWSFGKRPAEELYDLNKDPSNVHNLLAPPEGLQTHREVADRLKERLFEKLKQQGDPRMIGNGEVFEQYKYSRERFRNLYDKLMSGELDKADVPWITPSDFEEKGFEEWY